MEHEVTYTFSRALHMMRYSGKVMRCLEWGNTDTNHNAIFYDENIKKLQWTYGIIRDVGLESSEILGSWVEVKDEIH